MKKILLTLGCFAALSNVSAITVQPEGTNDESKTVAVAPVKAEEPAQTTSSETPAAENILSSTIVADADSDNEEVSSPKAKIARLATSSDNEDEREATSTQANEEASTTSVEQTNEESKEVVETASPKAEEEKAPTPKPEQPNDEEGNKEASQSAEE